MTASKAFLVRWASDEMGRKKEWIDVVVTSAQMPHAQLCSAAYFSLQQALAKEPCPLAVSPNVTRAHQIDTHQTSLSVFRN